MWIRRLHLLVIVSILSASAYADEAAVRATMRRTFPNNEVDSLQKTPVPGLVEVAIGGKVIYITEDGRYIFAGPLLDVATNRNLTDERIEQINAIPFTTLNLDWAIKIVKGKGERRIAIFEDPDCPYCKVLEETLRDFDNLTLYIFLYPIDQLHPQAAAKSRAVWCAPDRAKAWDEIMRTGAVPAGSSSCANPISNIAEFAKRNRITGTPTSILANGRRVVGAVPRAQLEQLLQQATNP